jgi:hypothetical protein
MLTFCRPKLLQILSPCVSARGETAGGWEMVSSMQGGGGGSTQGERICSSLGRQKVRRAFLLIIHFLYQGSY